MLNWTVVDQMCNNLLVYGVMKKILIKLSIVLNDYLIKANGENGEYRMLIFFIFVSSSIV